MSKPDLYAGSTLSRLMGRVAFFLLLGAIGALIAGEWAAVAVFLVLSGLASYGGYRAAGGARNPALYDGGKPLTPLIHDEEAVVDWFLQFDEKIRDFRNNFPSLLPVVRKEVLLALHQHESPSALQDYVKSLGDRHLKVLERLAHQQVGDDIGIKEKLQALQEEAVVAAKMRILGYFLLRKYGIQPK